MQNVFTGNKNQGTSLVSATNYNLIYNTFGTPVSAFRGLNEQTYTLEKLTLSGESTYFTDQINSSTTIYNRAGIDFKKTVLTKELYRLEIAKAGTSGNAQSLSVFDPLVINNLNKNYDFINYSKVISLAGAPATTTSATANGVYAFLLGRILSLSSVFEPDAIKTLYIAPIIQNVLVGDYITGSGITYFDALNTQALNYNCRIIVGKGYQNGSGTTHRSVLVVDENLLKVSGSPAFVEKEFEVEEKDLFVRRYGFMSDAFYKNADTTAQDTNIVTVIDITIP